MWTAWSLLRNREGMHKQVPDAQLVDAYCGDQRPQSSLRHTLMVERNLIVARRFFVR
jgi:hypothetical protein